MKFFLGCAGLTALLAGFWSCSDPAGKLPEYGRVPAFTMTDTDGHRFTGEQMNGLVWVVDFIYANCPAECPRMSSQMHKVEAQFKDEPDVRFLSISVDPARDTPAVLGSFARRWGAPNRQWTFLTGGADSVHLLAYTTFHVGDVIDRMEHSSKFALVDKSREIRGYYSSFDAESLAQMRRDIESLRRSKGQWSLKP